MQYHVLVDHVIKYGVIHCTHWNSAAKPIEAVQQEVDS